MTDWTKSRLFRDSSWAIFGNGMGYGLLLLSGVLIARLLGKDVYGEYGFVKTTMFQFAAFATLGLGYTSTKFVAEYVTRDLTQVRGVVRASLLITTVLGLSIATLLFLFSTSLAAWLDEPTLRTAFQALGVIIVLRALATTQMGLLSGFGAFKPLAFINTISGVFMLAVCIPLTYLLGLRGALLSLVLSQALLVALCTVYIHKYNRLLPRCTGGKDKQVWHIVRFSLPVAMQELTFALGRWLGILIITKLSSLGEVGVFTACELWGSVILIVPTLLSNVMLAHLSYNAGDMAKQRRGVSLMLGINLVCTMLPLIVIMAIAPFIVSFYGATFAGMTPVLRLLIFSTVFMCLSNVLSSELIAEGRTWMLFFIRATRDTLTVVLGFTLITRHAGASAAYDYTLSTVVCSALFFAMLLAYYKLRICR